MRRFPTTIKVERKESEMHHAMPSGLEIGTVAKLLIFAVEVFSMVSTLRKKFCLVKTESNRRNFWRKLFNFKMLTNLCDL